MEWKWSTCDMIWIGLVLFALALSWHSLTSLEMKKKTKIICEVIAIVIMLLFPFGRTWEVNKLINDNDYRLIEQTRLGAFSEVSSEKHLNKPHWLGFYFVNHENKLVCREYRFTIKPRSMEQVQLK